MSIRRSHTDIAIAAQWAVRNAQSTRHRIFLAGELGDCPIDECPVLSPLLAKTFGRLQRACSLQSIA